VSNLQKLAPYLGHGDGPRKRSSFEIIMATLDVIDRGCYRGTRIMYSVNTSWVPLLKILAFLSRKDLIEARENPRKSRTEYYITQKGRAVLKLYRDLIFALSFEMNDQ